MPTHPAEPDMTSNQPRRPHLSLADQHERSVDVPSRTALTRPAAFAHPRGGCRVSGGVLHL
jgi:hypothetical protein